MTTSGTTIFQDSFDILEMVEEAYEQVGLEYRAGYSLKTARRSLDLLTKEWANRGINLWTIKETMVAVTANSATVTLEEDTIDILEANWRTGSGQNQNDRMLTRLSVSEWSHVTNKNLTAQPTQYWINRVQPAPIMNLWPLPVENGTLIYWRLRRIEDAGNYTNTMDVPPRFLPALVSGLSFYLAIKTPAASDKLPFLQQEYERQFKLAAEEDRERVSTWLVPDMNGYSRNV